MSLGITADQMRLEHSRQGARLREQYPELPEVGRLFAAACKLVERGVESGEVRVAPESEAPSEPLGGGAGNSGRHDTAWWDQVKHEMGGES